MKFFFDLFPVVLFFLAFKFYGIYVATAVAIAATFIQVAWAWARHSKVDPMLWASLAIIVLFGGATLLLHDETFVKWKPTVLYWLFAAVLLCADIFMGKNLIRVVMQSQITVPDAVWRKLNLSWVIFLALMGGVNLYVAYHFSTESWVNFKLFGSLALMLLFVVLQGLMLAKHIEDKEVE
ncbi:MAG TPA: septation protein A [Burkholderiales bacterium]|nr:septation protein A [Burkholderiales bacterium]